MATLAEQIAILKRELVLDASLSIPDTIEAAAHTLGYSPSPDEPLATRAHNLLKQLGKDMTSLEHAAASKLQAAQRAKSGKHNSVTTPAAADPERIAKIKEKVAETKAWFAEMRAEKEAKQSAQQADKEAKAAANCEETEEAAEPTIYVWDSNEMEVLGPAIAGLHTRGIASLAFSKDGMLLFSVGRDTSHSDGHGGHGPAEVFFFPIFGANSSHFH